MPFELVIFDCDGVLVDTERLANRVLANIITDLGHPITGLECQKRFMGRTLEAVQSMVEGLTGKRLPKSWPEEVRERDLEAFAAGVPPVEGISQVLDTLDNRGLPYCVGSSGRYEKMRTTLGSAGLLDRLEGLLYSAQDCAHGKPSPDIFLYAAKGMKTDPARCVVIEDSVPGVKAARAAGMACFGFAGDPASDRAAMEAEGAVLFDNMQHLPELLFDKVAA
ncbi:HAD family hydrolase [Roseibium sp. RKSG952]|nr:HAD family hydrolase [Roseibium sp. RKSG952]